MLEARWVAMFNLVGWEYEYEPFECNYYIPDFFLKHGTHPVMVEVKPAATLGELEGYARDVEQGLAGHWEHDYLVVGASATFGRAIGWQGQYVPGYAEYRDYDAHYVDSPHWNAAPAFWHRCCNHAHAFHHQDTFLSQPC